MGVGEPSALYLHARPAFRSSRRDKCSTLHRGGDPKQCAGGQAIPIVLRLKTAPVKYELSGAHSSSRAA
jgi:hypothetical protein